MKNNMNLSVDETIEEVNIFDSGYNDSWLIIFIDLIALLIVVFVMLFSMSVIDTSIWRSFSQKSSLGLDIVLHDNINSESNLSVISHEQIKGIDLVYLQSILQERWKGDALLSQAYLYQNSDGLVISLPDEVLFSSGSTSLSREALRILQKISLQLSLIPNSIFIDGHTDAQSFENIEYSNWELSLDRALQVKKTIVNNGIEKKIIVRGFGKGKAKNFLSHEENIELLTRDRRVDIIIAFEKNDDE